MNSFFKDIIGVVAGIDECKTFYNKYKRKYCVKRDVMINDEDASVILTLWEKKVTLYSCYCSNIIFLT